MKICIMFLILLMSSNGFSQKREISIKANKGYSTYFNKPKYEKVVDSAFIIANAVFNSVEFRALFDSVTFPYWNHCIIEYCAANRKYAGNETINGKTILDSLFAQSDVAMTIFFKKKSPSSLGATCPKTYETTAYCENIRADMPNLPLSYAIAANLCHEYMHQVGFCHLKNSFKQPDDEHPDPEGFKTDIAYFVGWESYYILTKWYKEGRKIKGL